MHEFVRCGFDPRKGYDKPSYGELFSRTSEFLAETDPFHNDQPADEFTPRSSWFVCRMAYLIAFYENVVLWFAFYVILLTVFHEYVCFFVIPFHVILLDTKKKYTAWVVLDRIRFFWFVRIRLCSKGGVVSWSWLYSRVVVIVVVKRIVHRFQIMFKSKCTFFLLLECH